MFWKFYNIVVIAAIILQLFFLLQTFQNYRYVIKKFKRDRSCYRPRTLLTVPCKGIDNAFEKNIASFFDLDFDNYVLCFVVEDESDPAYEKLCRIKDKFASTSKTQDVSILIAGKTVSCSQKIHNLLCSCRNAPADTEVFAFADSDACIRPDWLSHLLYPLAKPKNGASTGYRWFVPQQNNLATLALSAINAKVAQLLGNSRFNQAWGGSMAIKAETFYQLGLDKIWQNVISDDLTLSRTVRKAGLKMVFVPACLVASYEKTTWPGLFEFARRQFLITRITSPATWWFGLFSSVYSLSGLWAGAALAVCAASANAGNLMLYIAMPIVFFIGQFIRAILRQTMIVKLLPDDFEEMKPAIFADIFGNPIWSWLLFICIAASAFGRTITWRGLRYKLISPTETSIAP